MSNEPTNKEILQALQEFRADITQKVVANTEAIEGNRQGIESNRDAIEMIARNLAQTEDRLTKSLENFKSKHQSDMDIVRDDIRVLKTKVGV